MSDAEIKELLGSAEYIRLKMNLVIDLAQKAKWAKSNEQIKYILTIASVIDEVLKNLGLKVGE